MRYDNAPEKSLVYSVFPHQKSKKKKSTFQKKEGGNPLLWRQQRKQRHFR